MVNSFQSTLPLRGATQDAGKFVAQVGISIHTPLAGSDYYPVSHLEYAPISIHTPLAGSDVVGVVCAAEDLEISIHTPLAGSDRRNETFLTK